MSYPSYTPPPTRKRSTCSIACLGCLGLFALVVLVAGGFLAPKGIRAYRDLMSHEQTWNAITQSWNPPTGSALFPKAFDRYHLVADGKSGMQPLRWLPASGRQADYEGLDGHTYRVYAFHGNDLECEALAGRIRQSVQTRFSFRSTMNGTHFLRYEGHPPVEKGFTWTSKGWLFLARSRDGDVEAFLKAYLSSISRSAASGAI